MNDNKDMSLENLINDALDDSVEELSPEVQRRLTPLRIEAAQTAPKTTWSGNGNSWKFATAFSFAFAVALSWQYWPTVEDSPQFNVAEISPFAEVLEEDLEMLEEMEFVYWMAEEVAGEADSETVTL